MDQEKFPTCITSGQLIYLTSVLSTFEKNPRDREVLEWIQGIEKEFDILLTLALTRAEKKPCDSTTDLSWWTLLRALRLLAVDGKDPEHIREAREKYLLTFEQLSTSPNPLVVLKVRVLLKTMHVVAKDIHLRARAQNS